MELLTESATSNVLLAAAARSANSSFVLRRRTSVSPSASVNGLDTLRCAVCGNNCSNCSRRGPHVLHGRWIAPQRPFFPFLERVAQEESGVLSCGDCATTLLGQWDHFEANRVPLQKRVYFLHGTPLTSSATSSSPTMDMSAGSSSTSRHHQLHSAARHSHHHLTSQLIPSTLALALNGRGNDQLSSLQAALKLSGASFGTNAVGSGVLDLSNNNSSSVQRPHHIQSTTPPRATANLVQVKHECLGCGRGTLASGQICDSCAANVQQPQHRTPTTSPMHMLVDRPSASVLHTRRSDHAHVQWTDALERTASHRGGGRYPASHTAQATSQQQQHYSTNPSSRHSSTSSDHSIQLTVQVASPPPLPAHSHYTHDQPLLTTVTTLPTHTVTSSTSSSKHNGGHGSSCSADYSDAMVQHSTLSHPSQQPPSQVNSGVSTPLDALVQAIARPAPPCSLCSVCGCVEEGATSFVLLLEADQRDLTYPYFPSLLTSSAAAKGSVLTSCCTFCYHTLVNQWIAYETSSVQSPDRRLYNVSQYRCYVCGVMTFRQRVHAVAVKDFSFLSQHERPQGALVLNGGEHVVSCQTCFDSLSSQFKDFERMKVPLAMRQYNWMRQYKPAPSSEPRSAPSPPSSHHHQHAKEASASGTHHHLAASTLATVARNASNGQHCLSNGSADTSFAAALKKLASAKPVEPVFRHHYPAAHPSVTSGISSSSLSRSNINAVNLHQSHKLQQQQQQQQQQQHHEVNLSTQPSYVWTQQQPSRKPAHSLWRPQCDQQQQQPLALSQPHGHSNGNNAEVPPSPSYGLSNCLRGPKPIWPVHHAASHEPLRQAGPHNHSSQVSAGQLEANPFTASKRSQPSPVTDYSANIDRSQNSVPTKSVVVVPQQPPPVVLVSTLDREAKRRRTAREQHSDGESHSSEFSQGSSFDESSGSCLSDTDMSEAEALKTAPVRPAIVRMAARRRRVMLLRSPLPLMPSGDPDKKCFLRSLGLVTPGEQRDLKWRSFLRARVRFERPPVPVSDSFADALSSNYKKRLPSSTLLPCHVSCSPDKRTYFEQTLGLFKQHDTNAMKQKEYLWTSVQLSLGKSNKSDFRIKNNLKTESIDRWFSSLSASAGDHGSRSSEGSASQLRSSEACASRTEPQLWTNSNGQSSLCHSGKRKWAASQYNGHSSSSESVSPGFCKSPVSSRFEWPVTKDCQSLEEIFLEAYERHQSERTKECQFLEARLEEQRAEESALQIRAAQMNEQLQTLEDFCRLKKIIHDLKR